MNHLDFLFVRVGIQSKGIGQAIWKEIENIYPNTKIWKTCTPFYINKLKFKIVEYYNKKHLDSNMKEDIYEEDNGMFEFEKFTKFYKKYLIYISKFVEEKL